MKVTNKPARLRQRLFAGLLVLLAAPALAQQQAADASAEQAREWLERMRQAVRDLNYEGTFVYRHRGQLETMRIIHRSSVAGERERLYSLNGAAREIIRDDSRVTCILPDDRAVVVDRRETQNPFAELVPADIERLGQHYRFAVLGDGRIAGRDAKSIAIWPRDEFRYGYRFWIDRETGLLLASNLFNELADPVEQLMFTSLSTPEEIPDEHLEPSINGEGFTWYREQRLPAKPEPTTLESAGWTAERLPPGFELVAAEARALPAGERPVTHLLYSDGLATVSVYIEPRGNLQPFKGHSRMGAVNAYGRTVAQHQVTVVGEVPAATVEFIGQAMRPDHGQSG